MSHAKLSASGSHRWMACAGSVEAEAGIVEQSSPYAQEGTVAHAIAEMALRGGHRAEAYVGKTIDDVTVDWEMADAVQAYVDYVNELRGTTFVERRVSFDTWVPGGFGTADAVVIGEKLISVVDLKFGKGVRVDAENNSQAMLYALGVINDLGPILDGDELIHMAIVQPRINHLSEWTITQEELRAWAEDTVKPAAALALTDNAPRTPGEKQCRFCKAQASCPALAQHIISVATDGFDEITPETVVNPAEISMERLGTLLGSLELIRSWCNAVEDRAKALMLEEHVEIPGFKVVAGRGSREWTDEAAAEKALKRKLGAKNIYSKKLLSPAQAEKLLGKHDKIITTYVNKRDGAPTVAPLSDKRPALNIDHAADFDEVA